MKVESDPRCKFSNLSNWKEEAWKKIYIYIYQGFNGIRTRDLREYRCDALPTKLWSLQDLQVFEEGGLFMWAGSIS